MKVAVGTDSLASVDDLNLFSELKTMRWLAPNVPAAKILESATLIGARALGLGDELGSLTPGKRAEMIAVRPAGAVSMTSKSSCSSGIAAGANRIWTLEPLKPSNP